MAVVIHELELVPREATPTGTTPAQGPQPGDARAASVAVLEVRRIGRHEHARGLRVWAH